MPILPAELLSLIVEFAPLFSKPVWEHAKVERVEFVEDQITIKHVIPISDHRPALLRLAATILRFIASAPPIAG